MRKKAVLVFVIFTKLRTGDRKFQELRPKLAKIATRGDELPTHRKLISSRARCDGQALFLTLCKIQSPHSGHGADLGRMRTAPASLTILQFFQTVFHDFAGRNVKNWQSRWREENMFLQTSHAGETYRCSTSFSLTPRSLHFYAYTIIDSIAMHTQSGTPHAYTIMHSISMHTPSCTPHAYTIMHSISMHTPSCTPFQCIHHHALHFNAYTIMHSISMHTPSCTPFLCIHPNLRGKRNGEDSTGTFQRNAQSTTGFHSEENGQPEFERQRVKLEVEEIEKLEEPFSSLEVVRALKRMKRGKGVGIDKVSSEMLLGGGEMLWQNLAALLNVCWEEEFIPVDWMDGIVVPLHKGGDSCDIGNYREITLGSHIGKVFCSVLNARLSEVMESKILGEAQGGFRRNRRTTDQVFVVSGIGQIRRSQGKKTWMAFLDFKKAFPSVWREGLWEKMKEYGIDGKFLRVCQNLYCDVGARVRVGKVFSERYTIEEGLRQGCILSPSLFCLFLMDLADELERRGLGVKVTGTWMGACFFADDIVLMAESGKELQCMLDVVYKYANRWKLRFNASKCGVLVVGQKKSGKLWALGKEGIEEVDEYKYLGVWINRQVTGHNHVNHLEGKALGLQNLARGGKFWRDEEDIKAGLTMWEVVCKPVLNYGAEVWACSSKTDEQRLERIQNRAGRRILGLSWRFHGVVVRGELGWRKLKYDRHSSALKFAGRLRGMGWERWPKIVGEALSRLQNNGTWVDYIRSLIARYKLQTCWEDDRWNEKVWKKVVVEQVEREGKRAWREEVEGKQDLGSYKDRQFVLERADYIANSSGDKIRAEIKGKCEWGEHFQI